MRYFNNNAFEIGEPIYITEISKVLKDTPGVVDVLNISLVNKTGGRYSNVFMNLVKNKTKEKYEAFYPWLEENWKLSGAPSKEEFMNASYGIKRLQGMVKFMMSEDWSQRMPQFREYITKFDNQRGTDFTEVFPEMAGLLDPLLDNVKQSKLGEKILGLKKW